jgi:hypothetical protein
MHVFEVRVLFIGFKFNFLGILKRFKWSLINLAEKCVFCTGSVKKRVFQNIVKDFEINAKFFFFYIYRTRIIFLATKILAPHRYFL